jgi:hypothetical protein
LQGIHGSQKAGRKNKDPKPRVSAEKRKQKASQMKNREKKIDSGHANENNGLK